MQRRTSQQTALAPGARHTLNQTLMKESQLKVLQLEHDLKLKDMKL